MLATPIFYFKLRTSHNMKKVLIGIVLSLVCILSFSQERVNNTETYLQFEKTTKALKKVIGYRGSTGEWKSEKNQIYHAQLGDTQKFHKLTVKTTIYNDTLYYVLIRNYTGSSSSDRIVKAGDVYKYVAGGGSSKRDVLYFFTANEFEQIFHLNKEAKTIYSFKRYMEYTDSRGQSNLSKVSDYVLKSADKNKENDFMQIRIADDGKMVRFLLPHHKDETWDEDEDWFPTCYFEMPLKDFNKWLEPVAPLEK